MAELTEKRIQDILEMMDEVRPKMVEMYELWGDYLNKDAEIKKLQESGDKLTLGEKFVTPLAFRGIAKKKKRAEVNETIEMLKQEATEILDKYVSIELGISTGQYNSNPTVTLISVFPVGYIYPAHDEWTDDMNRHAFESFYSYFKTGRATSIKDAINLFEEDKHRIRMENLQKEAITQSRINTWAQIGANAFINARTRR